MPSNKLLYQLISIDVSPILISKSAVAFILNKRDHE